MAVAWTGSDTAPPQPQGSDDSRVNTSRLADFLAFSKGGVVGTSGKPAVCLRFDDWQDDIISLGIMEMLTSRSLPASIVLCSQLGSNPWNQIVTYDDLRRWNREYGMEFWSHGTDHKSPYADGMAGLVREIVTSKEQIEDEGIRVMGFAAPGVTAPGYGPPITGDLSNWDTEVGRLIQSTYALSETDQTGQYRHQPSTLRHGLGHHGGYDTGTKAEVIAYLESLITLKMSGQLFTHAGLIAGGMGITDWEAVLDHIVAMRDAGEIVVVTPSSMPFVDPGSDYRLNLLGNGDFTVTPPALSSTVFGNWRNVDGTLRYVETVADGPDGGTTNVLRINNSGLVTQEASQMIGRGLAGLTFILEGWCRAVEVNGITNSAGHLRLTDITTPANFDLDKTWPVTTAEWTHIRYCFTPPPSTDRMNMSLGRPASGSGSGQVQWSNVSIRPA